MKSKINKMKVLKLASVSFMLAFFFSAFTVADDAFEIQIDVAPNILNISSSATVITVHTDIAYSAVIGATVTLNGVAIDWWKSDSRGQFVAKFEMSAIEALPLNIGELNTLRLEGTSTLGDFRGEQAIKIIKNEPVGTGKK